MTITDVRKLRKGLTQLYIDGEPAVQVDSQVFLLSPYKMGSSIDDQQLYSLLQDSNQRRAREKALYILERRSHSKKELIDKIATTLPRDAAQEAAQHMEDIGLINDADFAKMYAKDLFERRRFGAMRVRQALLQKGIDRDFTGILLEEYANRDDNRSVNNIHTVLHKKYPLWQEDEKTKRRAINALQRLGYNWDAIRSALQSWDEDEE